MFPDRSSQSHPTPTANRELRTANYNLTMHRSSRRLLALAVAIVVFLLSSALLYQEAMLDIEGKPRTFWQSLSWAAGTLSTTGYGGDVRWDEPMMSVFVAVVQLFGLCLVFIFLPEGVSQFPGPR